MYQTMSYDEQIKMKSIQVKEILDAVVKDDYIFEGVKKSQNSLHTEIKWSFHSEMNIRTVPFL